MKTALPFTSRRAAGMLAPFLLLLALIAASSLATAQDTPEAEEEESHSFELEGYGEILFQHYDYGPDRRSSENGSPEDNRATISIPRAVFEMKYAFEDDLYMEAELEIEYGGTGAAMELEYEEFGEYEQEVEKGGEIVLEEIHLTKEFIPEFNVRVGHFILPVGLINSHHEPDDFFTTIRPEAETSIIPVTWHETGIQLFGSVADLDYSLQLVNGLDATGFSSEHWVMGGHQARFELARATDMAVVAALEYNGIDGLSVGGSYYRGNSTGNRPKPDMEGIDGYVNIVDGHVVYEGGGVTARGLVLHGSLQNAGLISVKNSRLARSLPVPKTPVASSALAWYGELGYNVVPLLWNDSIRRLIPFVRYEHYNAMETTAENVFADQRFNRDVITGGLNFFLTDEVVVKADFSHRTFGLDRYNDENTIGVAVGYVGEFFESD